MIESLPVRLAKAFAEYRKITKANILTDKFINSLPSCLPAPESVSIYKDSAFIYYNVTDVDETEITLIPSLSDFLKVKWIKTVHASFVEYATYIKADLAFHITFTLTPAGTCSITKIPTGETRMTDKTVRVEEPVYEFHINCNEGDL